MKKKKKKKEKSNKERKTFSKHGKHFLTKAQTILNGMYLL